MPTRSASAGNPTIPPAPLVTEYTYKVKMDQLTSNLLTLRRGAAAAFCGANGAHFCEQRMARRALRAALAVSQGGHGRLARARSAPLRVSGFCGPAQGRFRVVASTGVRTFTAPTGGSDGGDAVGDLREVAVDRSGLLGGAPRNVVGPSSTVTGEELGPKPAATELTRELCMMISMRGPITVADFMRQALAHPTYGYYMRGDVFGRAGDFTTSPEISQMFGELLGVW